MWDREASREGHNSVWDYVGCGAKVCWQAPSLTRMPAHKKSSLPPPPGLSPPPHPLCYISPTHPWQNWSPDDGMPPLPGGWCDAFVHLHGASGEQEGLTYDARSNPMLRKGNRLRRRLDRIFCKLRRWRLEGLDMLGRQALPGLQWEGRPVLPSDHFGLLLRLRPAG